MIKSVMLNQSMARDAIADFVKENPKFTVTHIARAEELLQFVKFLSQRMLKRIESDDCYFVDMLEDLEKL